MVFSDYEQKKIIDEIVKANDSSLGTIIADIIKSNEDDRNDMLELWNEYKGEVPIKKVSISDPTKPNNKIANDFRGMIINQVVGYMFGNPVKYSISEGIYDKNKTALVQIELDAFLKRNGYKKLDAETATYSSVCGKAFRLMYYADRIDQDGKSKIDLIMKNIKPWEATTIYNATVDEIEYAMIYYKVSHVENDKTFERYKVEFYDNQNVYFYEETGEGNFVPDYTFGEFKQKHGFDYVPVIKFSNSALEMGDFEKVREAVDGYDKLISSALNDSETFANAYLAFFGVKPSKEVLEEAKRMGAFYIPTDMESKTDVKFITKDIVIQNVTEISTIINNDIYRFASGVDMADEKFSGASQTGESRKWKLFALETKCKDKERYYEEALGRLFMIASTFWRKLKNINISYEDITFTFSRNLPVDYSTQDLVMLHGAGLLSTETAVGNIPIVNDVQTELDRIDSDNAKSGLSLVDLEDDYTTTNSGSAA